MDRRGGRVALLLAALALGCERGEAPAPAVKEEVAPAPQAPEPAPAGNGWNVILVTLDTVRADRLGPYGWPHAVTPTLDRLAAEGVVFERAYAQVPLTIPSHSSILTGTWPFHHGVRDNGDHFLSDEQTTLAEVFKQARYHTAAATAAYVTERSWGFGQGFDAYFDELNIGKQQEGNKWRVERRGEEVITDALGWLDSVAAAPSPFFLWVHLFDAHAPYQPPEPFRTQFAQRPYDGEIAYLDAQLGRLVERLTALGELDKTVVLITADHGESLGEHGEETHGLLVYDSTTHVPMIVRLPEQRHKGTRVAAPAGGVDVMPTLLELTGLPVPAAVQGRSLKGAMEGQAPPELVSRLIYSESFYARYHYGWHEVQSVVDGRHRLIGGPRPELYDRSTDPAERSNLAPAHEALAPLQAGMAEMIQKGTPATPTHERTSLDQEQLERLQALGYVGAVGVDASQGASDLPDVKDKLPVLAQLRKAQALKARARSREDLDGVVAAYRAVVSAEPGMLDAQLTLGATLARQEKYTEAMAVLTAARDRAPGQSAFPLAMASVLRAMGRGDEALVLLDQALVIDPTSRSAWAEKVELLLSAGRTDDVIREGEVALRTAGDDQPRIHVALGAAHLERKALRPARHHLSRSVELIYTTAWAHHWLGVLLFLEGKNDEAIEQLREELRFYPDHLKSRYELVRIYGSLKMDEAYLAELDRLITLVPEDPQLLHAMAQTRFNKGEYQEALTWAQRCTATAPTYPEGYLILANTLARLGRKEEGRVAFEKARALKQAQ